MVFLVACVGRVFQFCISWLSQSSKNRFVRLLTFYFKGRRCIDAYILHIYYTWLFTIFFPKLNSTTIILRSRQLYFHILRFCYRLKISNRSVLNYKYFHRSTADFDFGCASNIIRCLVSRWRISWRSRLPYRWDRATAVTSRTPRQSRRRKRIRSTWLRAANLESPCYRIIRCSPTATDYSAVDTFGGSYRKESLQDFVLAFARTFVCFSLIIFTHSSAG